MKGGLWGVILLLACHPSRQVGQLVGVAEVKSLEEVSWNLIEIDGKTVYPVAGKTLFIQFDKANHRVAAFAGCNSIGGSYTHDGKDLHVTLISTRMACPDNMNTESAFIKAMEAVNEFYIRDNELELKNGSTTVARFLAGALPAH